MVNSCLLSYFGQFSYSDLTKVCLWLWTFPRFHPHPIWQHRYHFFLSLGFVSFIGQLRWGLVDIAKIGKRCSVRLCWITYIWQAKSHVYLSWHYPLGLIKFSPGATHWWAVTGAERLNWQCNSNGLTMVYCFELKKKEYLP